MYQIFCFTTQLDILESHLAALLLFFVSGANPKKPSAPDMFTESDDMFAADFDVSTLILSFAGRLNKNLSCATDFSFVLFFFLQSARMRAAGVGKDFKENPNLRDNWTDAEGYYRKLPCCLSDV